MNLLYLPVAHVWMFHLPELNRLNSRSVTDILPRFPSLQILAADMMFLSNTPSVFLAVTRPEASEKTLFTLGFYGIVGVCACGLCVHTRAPGADDRAIPLLWPLKPTMGVLCWYIKTGRKGGSRIMQCRAAAKRARMGVCACLCTCESAYTEMCCCGDLENTSHRNPNITDGM